MTSIFTSLCHLRDTHGGHQRNTHGCHLRDTHGGHQRDTHGATNEAPDVVAGTAPEYAKLAKNEFMMKFIKGCQYFVRYSPSKSSTHQVPCAGEPAFRAIKDSIEQKLHAKQKVEQLELQPLHLFGFATSQEFRDAVDELTARVEEQQEEDDSKDDGASMASSVEDIFKAGVAAMIQAKKGKTTASKPKKATSAREAAVAAPSAPVSVTQKASVFMKREPRSR